MKTRVSAYALAINEGRILMTQLAPYCMRGGSWTFPGGGMDHGELPEQTLLRETYEETGLRAQDPQLVDAHAFSESERGPFMAVQLIYRVRMHGTPKVLEQGGTTVAVKWVERSKLAQLPTVPFVAAVMMRLGAAGLLE